LVAGFPGFEFAGQVLPSRRPQFRDDFRILRGEPVLKFVQRLDGREDGGGDFNGFRFHGGSLSRFAGKGKSFPFHGITAYPGEDI
jgi:hypothetical protein